VNCKGVRNVVVVTDFVLYLKELEVLIELLLSLVLELRNTSTFRAGGLAEVLESVWDSIRCWKLTCHNSVMFKQLFCVTECLLVFGTESFVFPFCFKILLKYDDNIRTQSEFWCSQRRTIVIHALSSAQTLQGCHDSRRGMKVRECIRPLPVLWVTRLCWMFWSRPVSQWNNESDTCWEWRQPVTAWRSTAWGNERCCY
jgi:hypothetical protein